MLCIVIDTIRTLGQVSGLQKHCKRDSCLIIPQP